MAFVCGAMIVWGWSGARVFAHGGAVCGGRRRLFGVLVAYPIHWSIYAKRDWWGQGGFPRLWRGLVWYRCRC